MGTRDQTQLQGQNRKLAERAETPKDAEASEKGDELLINGLKTADVLELSEENTDKTTRTNYSVFGPGPELSLDWDSGPELSLQSGIQTQNSPQPEVQAQNSP